MPVGRGLPHTQTLPQRPNPPHNAAQSPVRGSVAAELLHVTSTRSGAGSLPGSCSAQEVCSGFLGDLDSAEHAAPAERTGLLLCKQRLPFPAAHRGERCAGAGRAAQGSASLSCGLGWPGPQQGDVMGWPGPWTWPLPAATSSLGGMGVTAAPQHPPPLPQRLSDEPWLQRRVLQHHPDAPACS